MVGTLSTMLVKKSGLGLLNSVTSTNEKYLSSKRSRTELIQDVMGEGVFSNGNHLLALREERRDGKKNWDDVNGTNHCLILRAKNIGAWLNVRGNMVTGTLLAVKEFLGFYVHVMMLPRPNLQIKCGFYGTSVDVCHILICSKGGLITTHHYKVRSELL